MVFITHGLYLCNGGTIESTYDTWTTSEVY